MQLYELTLILPTTATAAESEKVEKQIGQWIGKDGSLTVVEKREKQPLAYPIKKQTEGVYLFTTVQMNTDKAKEVIDKLQQSDAVLRHLLLRTKVVKKEKQKKTKKKGT